MSVDEMKNFNKGPTKNLFQLQDIIEYRKVIVVVLSVKLQSSEILVPENSFSSDRKICTGGRRIKLFNKHLEPEMRFSSELLLTAKGHAASMKEGNQVSEFFAKHKKLQPFYGWII